MKALILFIDDAKFGTLIPKIPHKKTEPSERAADS